MIVISALRKHVHILALCAGTVVAVMGVLLSVAQMSWCLPAVAQQASPPTVEPVLNA